MRSIDERKRTGSLGGCIIGADDESVYIQARRHHLSLFVPAVPLDFATARGGCLTMQLDNAAAGEVIDAEFDLDLFEEEESEEAPKKRRRRKKKAQ